MLGPASRRGGGERGWGCAARRSTSCDSWAQAPLQEIIIINNNSSIYLVLSSYNVPRWEIRLCYFIKFPQQPTGMTAHHPHYRLGVGPAKGTGPAPGPAGPLVARKSLFPSKREEPPGGRRKPPPTQSPGRDPNRPAGKCLASPSPSGFNIQSSTCRQGD